MFNNEHEVRFDVYCKKCKHCKKSENESPCDICLDHTVRYGSYIPTQYERAKQPTGQYKDPWAL